MISYTVFSNAPMAIVYTYIKNYIYIWVHHDYHIILNMFFNALMYIYVVHPTAIRCSVDPDRCAGSRALGIGRTSQACLQFGAGRASDVASDYLR